MLSADESAFRDYIASRRRPMVRTAFLLTGDWRTAEALVRVTLAKVYVAWTKVRQRDDPDLFAQRMLLGTYFNSLRRPWRRLSIDTELPDQPGGNPDRGPEDASRERLRVALMSVPPKQRAVLVLRFWLNYSAEQTADLLNCSVGTVHSRSQRALGRLHNGLDATGTGTMRRT